MATAEEWRARVTQWKASGCTAAEFGAQHGLSKKQLHNWAHRLGFTRGRNQEGVRAAPSVRLLRVVPQAKGRGGTNSSSPEGRMAPIRLSVAGATMDVPVGFDEVTLRRVLLVIKAAAAESGS